MLIQALGLEQARLTSLCGAGGKTSLMFALAREFVAQGQRVLITTTTKIAVEEAVGPWPSLAAGGVEQLLEEAQRLLHEGARGRGGAVISYSTRVGTRLAGFGPELVDSVNASRHFDRVLVEADGSARKPLKAPAAHEPVIPSSTDALIIVAGLNGLGTPLDEEHVFRAAIWAQLSGIELGSPVTPESLARVVAHPQGLARGCPARAGRMLYLNRADTPERRAAAKQAVEALAEAPGHKLKMAVSGYLLPEPAIVDAFRLA